MEVDGTFAAALVLFGRHSTYLITRGVSLYRTGLKMLLRHPKQADVMWSAERTSRGPLT